MEFAPLGDQAVMVYCDHEDAATRLADRVRAGRPGWCVDVVQAYVSVAVYYDMAAIDFAAARAWFEAVPAAATKGRRAARIHRLPCCYDLGLDFERVTLQTGLSRNEIIRLHSETTYTVYAIGFCPGFPYLGYLPEPLAGVTRLESPRVRVEAGSVGLTGRQTGIYTEARPGGWNIIGRTPLTLVDVRDGYFPLRTGDRVKFEKIGKREFKRLIGERLC